MSEFLPKEVREGLEKARKAALRRKSRLRICAGGETFQILRLRQDGFALDAETAPHLRGLVDIYDGSKHLYQALVVASREDEDRGELLFEFKRNTAATDKAPLDFYRDENAPIALIGH